MKYRKNILSLMVLLGLFFGAYFVYQFYKTFFWDNTQFEEKVAFVHIYEDDSFDDLLDKLSPLLISTNDFTAAAVKKGYNTRIKPGKFAIKKGSSNNDVVNSLRSKSLIVRVTFNNQERIQNLAGRVAQQIAPDSLTLLNAFLDPVFLKENGLNESNTMSIYLPNSYDFFWNTTAENFRNKMWSSFNKFWTPERIAKAKKLGFKPKEVINLAAIVQKETVKTDERKRVAGVYVNRLKRRMKLQADPTVIYAIKHKMKNFDTVIKRVLYKDLKVKSPYNTYQNKGLPPGPITMPDISSIQAVLNPEKHNYIYFVADPSNPGYHLFASTGRQHNRNKRKYTDWLDKQRVYR
ncbi:endolytic transglycosylase MltG [Flavobacteriaceae bacterium]|nr:endolytic transglycosylase MltG [Flavobacteriaceae bacterium]